MVHEMLVPSLRESLPCGGIQERIGYIALIEYIERIVELVSAAAIV